MDSFMYHSLPPLVEEIFSYFNPEPLGAASIAQCHRCILKDGTHVAVKIQHPDVKKNAYTDMDIVDVIFIIIDVCIVKLFLSSFL